jgi:hypothetical protein
MAKKRNKVHERRQKRKTGIKIKNKINKKNRHSAKTGDNERTCYEQRRS